MGKRRENRKLDCLWSVLVPSLIKQKENHDTNSFTILNDVEDHCQKAAMVPILPMEQGWQSMLWMCTQKVGCGLPLPDGQVCDNLVCLSGQEAEHSGKENLLGKCYSLQTLKITHRYVPHPSLMVPC